MLEFTGSGLWWSQNEHHKSFSILLLNQWMDSGLQVVNSHSTSSCACAASRARNEASILLGFALSSNWCEIADDRDGRTDDTEQGEQPQSERRPSRSDGRRDGRTAERAAGRSDEYKGRKELESFPGSVRVRLSLSFSCCEESSH